ncbi:antibiotic biosynthesis monooxygenase [Chitinivorax sp. PXF-14]|uniref:antibiotic biosynthesis monooxygenase family protein n=1 Tax=Chitinivorax sp. PXF-14 TaxID=3230488 RepID=UPI00346744B4
MTRPDGPYYAVIFTSKRCDGDDGYGAMAERMLSLAAQQPGYLGMDSARGTDGIGITVSYWQDEQSIVAWKGNVEHQLAQKLGRERWYEYFSVRVARVERSYDFPFPPQA